MIRRPLLLDEQREPSIRQLLGRLLTRAREADFAVARIRIAAIDLEPAELVRVRRCRVLVGRLDATTFAEAAHSIHLPPRRRNLEVLLAFADSGRVEVRAAGPDAWSPDFSVMRGLRTPVPGCARPVAIVGAHYFAKPFPVGGPALTCVVRGRETGERLGARFEEVWQRGHDVLPVVREGLENLLGQ